MGKKKSIVALLLCAALMLSMCGCGAATPAPTEPAPTEPPVTEPPVSQLYTQGAQPLREAENLAIELDVKKTIATEIETMVLRSEQELVFTGMGTDAFAASLNEEIDLGDVSDEFT
jgi:ABC-type glycerol-3-phosphate transport system substrate-binding protein